MSFSGTRFRLPEVRREPDSRRAMNLTPSPRLLMTRSRHRAHWARRVLTLAFLVVACVVSQRTVEAAIAFVQVRAAVPQSSPTTVTVTYQSAQTAGNLNV